MRWQPRFTQVDAVTVHRDALCKQERTLLRSLREASIATDDAMPWKVIVGGRKNAPDQARRDPVDIAVSSDKPSGNRANPVDNAGCARLGASRFQLSGASRAD